MSYIVKVIATIATPFAIAASAPAIAVASNSGIPLTPFVSSDNPTPVATGGTGSSSTASSTGSTCWLTDLPCSWYH
ncbi:hypothetical protein ACIHAX_32210 [Nocardia sp. NPDC051929]|uniref:hypothetical protein n=1 Tax=unclassified Nocardia TaxID=2637762 RepID=UPI003433D359